MKVRGQFCTTMGVKPAPYKFVHEFLCDLNLVWKNCQLFNAIGSLIFRSSQSMQRISNRLLYKYKIV